ncbi:MAG: Cna B-type domain-containing protein [Ruminococcus sp.]|nr:Cna B-type domain-containing protein [Ruminococcus sp.]
MRKESIKKIMLILMICVLMLSVSVPAFAQSEIDLSKKGSVSVSLRDGDKALASAEITLYQVANIIQKGSIYEYSFVDSFAGCGLSTNDFSNDKAAETLFKFVQSKKIIGISEKNDANGIAVFSNLPLGMYLAVQTGSVAGYADCSPFLVSVPLNQSGVFVYDVDATPKTDVVRLVDISVKKVWNDDGKNRPQSVTIELLKDDDVIETVVLSKKNSWRHTWKQLPYSDLWSVKEINVPLDYTPTYKQSCMEFTVTNTAKLIKTGRLNWPIPLLAGAGLLLFVLGWVIVFLKEDKKRK